MYNKVAQRFDQHEFSESVDIVVHEAISKRIVGMVVEIARDGERIYRRAAGFADRGLTKPVTSIAALALVDRGYVALDEPVTTYLPAFQPRLRDGAAAIITVRHLLTHTSGLSYGLFEKPDGPYHRAHVSDGLDCLV
jgi:CubicO group peptidase (beta-lactamase class C family)